MRFFAALLLSCIATAVALAPIYRVDEANDGVRGQFVVKIKDDVPDVDVVVDKLVALPSFNFYQGKINHRYYYAIKGFSAKLSDELVDIVSGLDAVEYIHQETIFRTQDVHGMHGVESWGLDRVDQRDLPMDDAYHPDGDGRGVNVYVIDTGVNIYHNDLAGRAMVGFDAFIEDRNDPAYSVDCHGHGSHCAGTVAGSVYGVAKGATIYAVRALGCRGAGTLGKITAAYDYVTREHIKPAVASMSLGGARNPFIDRATQGMIDAGVIVSVAAGNSDADACTFSPANVPDAITVAASDRDDTRAYFSNWGDCVDIFAPGVEINSMWYENPNANFTASGTSMACPHVSGAAAIVLGKYPWFTSQHVAANLVNSATNGKITDTKGSPNKLLYVPSSEH